MIHDLEAYHALHQYNLIFHKKTIDSDHAFERFRSNYFLPQEVEGISPAAQLAQKANQAFVDSQFSSIVSGAPKGTYTNLSALQSAYPNGAEGIFLVLESGHWYYWNSTTSAWLDGGVYQSTGIGDKTISPRKTNFIEVDTSFNKFDGNYLLNVGINSSSNLLVSNPNRNTLIVPVEGNKTYSIVKGVATDVFIIKSSTQSTLSVGGTLDGLVSVSATGTTLRQQVTTGASDKWLAVQFTTSGQEPYVEVTEGTRNTLVSDAYTLVAPNLDVYRKGDVYNKEEIHNFGFGHENIGYLHLDTDINLFDGIYKDGITLNSQFRIDAADELRKVALIKISPGKTYTVTRTASSLFRLGTHTKEIINVGESLDGTVKFESATENHYSFTAGASDRLLVVLTTYTGENPFLQVLEGYNSEIIQNYYPVSPIGIDMYSRKQIDSMIGGAEGQRKIRLIKSGSQLDIYLPSKKSLNYVHYVYKLVVDPTINSDVWRMWQMDVVDSTLSPLYATFDNTEWEGVLKESGGAGDFIGGHHGDERTTDIHMLVDGKPVDLTGPDFNLEVSDEIKIVNKSILNSFFDAGDDLFERIKVTTWTKDGMTIENKWKAIKSVRISVGYVAMLSLNRSVGSNRLVDYVRNNSDFSIESVEATTETKYTGATEYEFWGEDSGFYAKIELETDFNKYPTEQSFSTNAQTNKVKAYFDITYPYKDFNLGDVLSAKAIYTVVS
ncbi:hypothetical protein GIY11_01870 [Aerococcaceae bacterium DSM 109653]|uniref:Uncharacterized protein n=1 Tax=Fundicoccus ignavus TaxID=2664442 RepID=A0A844BKV0_9LACT|nr:hypothetical protein [Fundicoccus ignavus]MRI80778.1 hypothetical protein [Fundicoccus ignavus]